MELQRLKLENVKQRLLNGEQIKNARTENGQYIVQFTSGPEITFEEQYSETVEKTIRKVVDGVVENTLGNDTTLTQARTRMNNTLSGS